MELKKRWVAVVVIVLVMVGAMQAATLRPSVVRGQAGGEDSDAPYLYYFSDDLNAWVIERADGTDRRLLGQGLAMEEANTASGIWSPSGEWFRWSSSTYTKQDPWATPKNSNWQYWRTDASNVTHSSTGDFTFGSPTQDLILVEDARNWLRVPFFGRALPSWLYYLRYSLTDMQANTKEVVFEHKFEDLYTSSQVEWLEDGQFILFRYWRYRDGKADVTFVLRSPNGELTYYRTVADSYAVLPKGVIAHLHHRTLILTDLIHQQNRTIHLNIPTNLNFVMTWNDAGNGAFLLGWDSNRTVQGVWCLTINSPQLHFAQISYSSYSYSNRWEFSPTRRYLAFVNPQAELSYFDSMTGQIVPLKIAIEDGAYTDNRFKQFYWTDDDHLIVFPLDKMPYDGLPKQINVIDASINRVKTLALGISYYSPPQLSANGRYLAWSLVDSTRILDTSSGEITAIRPDSRAFYTNPGGRIIWHPSQDWFLVLPGDVGYIPGIASADGQYFRELYTENTVSWLPDQASVDALPFAPNIQSPVHVLKGNSTTIFGLVWGSNGQFLATGTGVWDVEMEQPVTEEIDPNLFQGSVETVPSWDNAEILAVSPNGRLAVATSPSPGDYMYPAVYDISSRELLSRFDSLVGRVRFACFSPDGKYLVVGGPYAAIEILDTQIWESVGTIPTPSFAVAFSPDGEYLAVGVSWDVEIWRVSDLIGERE
ncbi:MAG: hypothetical protein K8L91_26460 [Anaerolineae bacterium]|nr:hypothetical protein [Anaerolineae bacterium]